MAVDQRGTKNAEISALFSAEAIRLGYFLYEQLDSSTCRTHSAGKRPSATAGVGSLCLTETPVE